MASDTRFLNIDSSTGDFVQRSGQQTSSGAAAGDIVALNGSAQIDSSLLPAIAAAYTPRTDTANFNALINHLEQVDLATAAANVTSTLPDATLYSGQSLLVQVITTSASHHVAFASTSSQTINGASAASLPVLVNVDQTYFFISDGSNWWTISPVTDLANNVTGTLAVANGGTGHATLTVHDVILGNGTSAVTLVAPSATSGIALVSNGSSADPSFGAVALGASGAVSGFLPVLNSEGATTATAGSTSIPAGSMIYLDGSGLIQLADNTTPAKATGFSPVAISSSTPGTVVIGNGPNAGVTGLTPGVDYYLDAAGAVSATVPSTPGQILQKVGFAQSATKLQVILGPSTLLS